jgi:DNA polymerase elongation subunit (family B)
MEFQVYSVALEDRYPRGFAAGDTKECVLSNDFPHAPQSVVVEKQRDGCVAFVFGRAQDGRSVCARVEGVFPKLYFKMQEGETTHDVRQELEKEIEWKSSKGRLRVETKRFAHDYGYEFDENTPSKRKVHDYAEVSYPSKTAWQMACKIRRKEMHQNVRRQIVNARTEIKRLKEEMLSHRKHTMSGTQVDVDQYVTMEKRKTHLEDDVLVGLLERAQALDDEDFDGGEVDISLIGKSLRFAHEYFVDPTTRFLFEAGIQPSSWVRVPSTNIPAVRVTLCDVELQVGMDEFTRLERDLDAPYTSLNYDIETLGLDPDVSPVIQISMVFVTAGVRERHLVATGSVTAIEGVTIHECRGEAQLLITFRRLVVERDPDFVVAYNGVNFDNRYLAVRAEKSRNSTTCENVESFWYMSRFAFRPVHLRELRLSSSGMGDNLLRYLDMHGRANFDWFVKLKRDLTSEPNYRLNHFAKKFCGLQKEDMDYKEIPILQAGTADDRARLGRYCVVDSELLEDLNQARTMIVEILQFSSVFGVLPEWVYFRGQQVRFIAQLLRAVRSSEDVPLLLNRPLNGFVGEGVASFKGATVNDPKKGFYKERPVATLDWASLYPSIMRAHNLCHSTHVLDPQFFFEPGVVEYRVSEDFVTYFVTAERHKGVLPRILEDLGSRRKVAKRRAKENAQRSKDETESVENRGRFAALAKVFDGQQLALKVSMNSIYGACGATGTGKFPDLAISATVTLQGRIAMNIKKDILPKRFPGIDIVYGGEWVSLFSTTFVFLIVPHCLDRHRFGDGDLCGRIRRSNLRRSWRRSVCVRDGPLCVSRLPPDDPRV